MVAEIEDAAAQADLTNILEGITEQYGLRTALDVADAVRRAAMEGRMDGRNYVGCNCGAGADCPETRVCVVGHIALALDSYEDGHDGLEAIPMVPNWNYHIAGISPIESLVEDVRPGDTPETSRYLATLVHWVDGWMNARAI